jgi:hypothetical protein
MTTGGVGLPESSSTKLTSVANILVDIAAVKTASVPIKQKEIQRLQ